MSAHDKSLCAFVCVYVCGGYETDERGERSPKTAYFRLREDTQDDGILCLVIINNIICKSMFIIIYIYAQHDVMTASNDGMPSFHVSPIHNMTSFYAPEEASAFEEAS